MSQRVHFRGDSGRRFSNASSSQNSYSDRSSQSQQSRSTAPTDYSGSPQMEYRPRLPRPETFPRLERAPCRQLPPNPEDSEIYAQSLNSDEYDDFDGESIDIVDPEYADDDDEEDYDLPPPALEASPAAPKDYAANFPTPSRITIRHQEDVRDGNMNLVLETQQGRWVDGSRGPMILQHVKIEDLKTRKFSIRRYCRDSGREICSTKLGPLPANGIIPNVKRSLSNALRRRHTDGGEGSLRRTDSGYASMAGAERELDDDDEEVAPEPSDRPLSRNLISLEFSNYARVVAKRRGFRNPRYDFEYWGHNYHWKVNHKRDGDFTEVSYHLFREGHRRPLAHIVPVPLTIDEAEVEEEKGGWIPPSSFWIKDSEVLRKPNTDLAEMWIATGLVALIDNCIRAKFEHERREFVIPIGNSSSVRMELVSPKALIDQAFPKRPGSSRRDSASMQSSSSRHTRH